MAVRNHFISLNNTNFNLCCSVYYFLFEFLVRCYQQICVDYKDVGWTCDYPKDGKEEEQNKKSICSETVYYSENGQIIMYLRTNGYGHYDRVEKFKNGKEACIDFIDEEDASNATTCFCTADLCNNIKFKLPVGAKIRDDVVDWT